MSEESETSVAEERIPHLSGEIKIGRLIRRRQVLSAESI